MEAIPGIGPARAETLRSAGYGDVEAVVEASPEDLAELASLGFASARNIKRNVGGGGSGAVGGGRSSKLTQERQEAIAGMIEEGLSIAAACRAAEIAERTFYGWMDRGEEDETGAYAEFCERIRRARGEEERRFTERPTRR